MFSGARRHVMAHFSARAGLLQAMARFGKNNIYVINQFLVSYLLQSCSISVVYTLYVVEKCSFIALQLYYYNYKLDLAEFLSFVLVHCV